LSWHIQSCRFPKCERRKIVSCTHFLRTPADPSIQFGLAMPCLFKRAIAMRCLMTSTIVFYVSHLRKFRPFYSVLAVAVLNARILIGIGERSDSADETGLRTIVQTRGEVYPLSGAPYTRELLIWRFERTIQADLDQCSSA
jgi:hypothetical protein